MYDYDEGCDDHPRAGGAGGRGAERRVRNDDRTHRSPPTTSHTETGLTRPGLLYALSETKLPCDTRQDGAPGSEKGHLKILGRVDTNQLLAVDGKSMPEQ
jgi:hypothetical protein